MPDLKKQKPAAVKPQRDPSGWTGGGRRAFPLACEVRLYLAFGSLEVTTSSVSCEGFKFISAVFFFVGEQFPCELAVGPYESAGSPFTLSCRARVTRVDAHLHCGYEVACEFEEYYVAPRKPLPNS